MPHHSVRPTPSNASSSATAGARRVHDSIRSRSDPAGMQIRSETRRRQMADRPGPHRYCPRSGCIPAAANLPSAEGDTMCLGNASMPAGTPHRMPRGAPIRYPSAVGLSSIDPRGRRACLQSGPIGHCHRRDPNLPSSVEVRYRLAASAAGAAPSVFQAASFCSAASRSGASSWALIASNWRTAPTSPARAASPNHL